MKAAVLTAPRSFEIRDLPDPEPAEGEILVKLKACGICTLEQRLYTGAMTMPLPLIPGHEASGEIVHVGKSVVGDFRLGGRVALDLVLRCGECYYCRIGKSNLCANRFKKGQRVLGGFAEYIAVRPSQVHPLPDSLSFQEASFAEPLACCIHSLKRLKVAMTEDLLVAGAGVMGLLHLLAARCMGLRVTLSDPDPERRKMAQALGADFIVDPGASSLPEFAKEITGGLGFSSCVVTSPAPQAFETAVASMAKAARLNIYTAYDSAMTIPLDANVVHRQELLITGTEGRLEEDFLQAVRLLSFGKVDVRPLISATTSFSTIHEGFAAALGKKAYRVLLEHEAP
ncbi:MAG TPA: alcohol dehydrogenase catalytic domain-containing protein [Rectinemataceae bacterium]